MAEESAFREALDFFARLGVFDVILPFLLIFTIVFAILEKTKIFGVEKIGDSSYTKKNLNSMVAFVISFFTIASSEIVEIITTVSSQMVVVLVAIVFFLLLLGAFQKESKESFYLEGGFRVVFMIVVSVALAAIFLNAIKNDDKSWLEWILDWLGDIANNELVGSIVLIIIVVAIIFYITRDTKRKEA